jgi:valyl-tRNA synthetase
LYNPDQRGVEARKSAQQGLYAGIFNVLKLMAPIMPHITEEIYQLYFAEKENQTSIHQAKWPQHQEEMIDNKIELAGDLGVDIINTVRKFKSENQLSMKEELVQLVLINKEDGFSEMIKSIEDDLKAVLKVKEITFSGETSLESDKFGIKVGIVK